MLELLVRNWWVVALRGVLAIAFGVMALAWPGLTLKVLIVMFGAYAMVDGVFSIVAALSGAAPQNRWWTWVLWGLLGIAAGVVTFLYPGLTALMLLYVIAFWSIVHGVTEIVAAIQLRKVIKNEWLLILAGVCSVIFGGLLLARPGTGALAVILLIGWMSIAIGILLVLFSLRLKGMKNRMQEVVAKARTA